MASKSLLAAGYAGLLAQVKQRVRIAQVKAALSANRELVLLYWDIGRAILRAQGDQGWGAKVVARLAQDLRREFPEMSGFSRANLLFMRAFAEAWSHSTIVLQPVRQLPSENPRHAVAKNNLLATELSVSQTAAVIFWFGVTAFRNDESQDHYYTKESGTRSAGEDGAERARTHGL
jgi:hypothetical protein